MTSNVIHPSFAGKVALVAGASRGIGAATALAFGDAGAAVVVGARDSEALESVAEDISWHEVSDPGDAAVRRGSNRQYGFPRGT